MARIYRFVIAVVAGFSLVALAPPTFAQGNSNKAAADQAQSDKGMAKGKADKGGGPDKVKPTKAKHHNGKDLVGDKIKTNGRHVIDKKGDYTAAVDIQGGKIAGMKVSHATKGDIPVKKYKTTKKMAETDALRRAGFQRAAFVQVQSTYIGTTYIGYSYVDEYGTEEIYWYPYDMILDGDTGAVEYVPAY